MGRGRAERPAGRGAAWRSWTSWVLLRTKLASSFILSSLPHLQAGDDSMSSPPCPPHTFTFLKTLAKSQELIATCQGQPGKQGTDLGWTKSTHTGVEPGRAGGGVGDFILQEQPPSSQACGKKSVQKRLSVWERTASSALQSGLQTGVVQSRAQRGHRAGEDRLN